MKPFPAILLLSCAVATAAVQPGDIIFNEVRFNPKGSDVKVFEAVELLVVADKVNLNGLQVSDRNVWNEPEEDQCTLNDLGQGFLSQVRGGTLIVIYEGRGEDDTNSEDFTLTFYAKSSLYCNSAPTGKAFALYNQADNLHLLHNNRQIDFVKYSTQEKMNPRSGNPGSLKWEGGAEGYIDITSENGKTGFRFTGGSAEWNDHPAIWRTYIGAEDDNLGKPNGSRNTEWINLLRSRTRFDQSVSSEKVVPSDTQ